MGPPKHGQAIAHDRKADKMNHPVLDHGHGQGGQAADQQPGGDHVLGPGAIADKAVDQLAHSVKDKADGGKEPGIFLGEEGFLHHLGRGDA